MSQEEDKAAAFGLENAAELLVVTTGL